MRTVLVTGGSGAFGQAFVRHLLSKNLAESIRVFSRSESTQAKLEAELNDSRLRFLVGDVRDADRLRRACAGVDTVIHAAALKRVEKCEKDPHEAVKTNVLGTMNVADACIDCGVERAVYLSTDKAAAPATLYGVTKLCGERLWIQSNGLSAGTVTKFSATRYGNVLNSTGSVVPIWKQQALHGGPVTVTDPSHTRFFMTLDDAVGLVLLALERMKGGEVFIPRAKAAPITSLTEAVAPGVPRQIIGARPGEKRHELLISQDEAHQVRDDGDVYVLEPLIQGWTTPGYGGVRVGETFQLRSDTAEQLSTDDLRGMIG